MSDDLAELRSIYWLPRSLDFDADALGIEAPAILGGVPGWIALPSVDPESKKLAGPAGWPEPDRFLGWGSSSAADSARCTVSAIGFRSAEPVTPSTAQEVAAGWRPWFDRVRDWLQAMLHVDLDPKYDSSSIDIETSGVSLWLNDVALQVIGRVVVYERNDVAIPAPLWPALCSLASGMERPVAALALLGQAATAYERDEHRRAVIDAATAIEIILAGIVEELCSTAPDSVAALVRSAASRWTLGGYREHLGRTPGVDLPPDFTTDVVALRNRVAHEGYDPSPDEALSILNVATEIVISRTDGLLVRRVDDV